MLECGSGGLGCDEDDAVVGAILDVEQAAERVGQLCAVGAHLGDEL